MTTITVLMDDFGDKAEGPLFKGTNTTAAFSFRDNIIRLQLESHDKGLAVITGTNEAGESGLIRGYTIPVDMKLKEGDEAGIPGFESEIRIRHERG